jgi:SnoaL-like protein
MSITEARGPAARLALVEEHVRLENRHDLDGIMGTFGASARYDEEPWDDHHIGREAVRAYYDALLRAMPDLAIEVGQRHVAGDAIWVPISKLSKRRTSKSAAKRISLATPSPTCATMVRMS